MTPAAPDVVVIGAGVIGCAIARELARRGRDVLVLERDSPGRRATWAAAGMLSPLGEAVVGGAFLELADASLQRFANFAHELQEESGIDVEYRTTGKMHVSTGADDDDLRDLAAGPRAARFGISLIDGDAARALEPALSETISLAVLIGRDHRVNNRLLAQALLSAATAAGVRFRTAAAAAQLAVRRGAVEGVRLLSGEHIAAPRVILAAGAWSSTIEGLPRALPVRPVKGQMFAVDGRAGRTDRSTDLLIQRTIYSSACYILPRDDGRLLVGATVEDVGFRKGATPRGMSRLMHAATDIVPAIADMPLLETWAGFRPGTPDDLPVLAEDPAARGLFYATGHYRNGILLAPITAVCIADLVTGVRPPIDLAEFGVARFANGS
jgi:glycine oxidase